ncbi:MAG TPA: hypothetical protein VNP04_15515 [Alphaproteobacteria bacterium]|nr:hypothetical protein [Alphaproteobacteria bacterium]
MTHRQPRYNLYGEPVAPLVDAREEPMAQRPANRDAIDGLQLALRDLWQKILCRGWYGSVTLELSVKDGVLNQDVSITERRQRRIRE